MSLYSTKRELGICSRGIRFIIERTWIDILKIDVPLQAREFFLNSGAGAMLEAYAYYDHDIVFQIVVGIIDSETVYKNSPEMTIVQATSCQ